MLQRTCLQLLKILRHSQQMFTLVLYIHFLNTPKVKKGPVLGARSCPTWCFLGDIGDLTLGQRKNTGLLLGTYLSPSFSLREKGHIQAEEQSLEALVLRRNSVLMLSHKIFSNVQRENPNRSEERIAVS